MLFKLELSYQCCLCQASADSPRRSSKKSKSKTSTSVEASQQTGEARLAAALQFIDQSELSEADSFQLVEVIVNKRGKGDWVRKVGAQTISEFYLYTQIDHNQLILIIHLYM